MYLKWEKSKTSILFLDTKLEITSNSLITRVFEKALKKHQYIPYSSAHPISVKKAFVKAKRIRYSIICSQETDRLNTENKLYNNLLRRGYSREILDQWFSTSLIKKDKKLLEFILLSKYNPV